MANNPAWESLLKLIPQELHSQVTPVLEEWDKGVNSRFAKYAPYKQIVDAEVDPSFLVDALRFANDFESDPAALVAKANEHFKLGYLTPEEAKALNADPNEESLFGEDGMNKEAILNSPEFKELRDAVMEMRLESQTEKEQREQQEAIDAFEQEMDTFLEDKGNVNRLFFSNLRASGLSNEAALEQYQKTVAEMLGKDPSEIDLGKQDQPNGSQAPAIMGGDGNVGSGQPTEKIDYGKMKKDDVDDLVIQMLQGQTGN